MTYYYIQLGLDGVAGTHVQTTARGSPIQQLAEMGFGEVEASAALRLASGSVALAVNWLLGGIVDSES